MHSHLDSHYLCVIVMDVRFKVPANFYISGQSQSGKSFLVRQLLHYVNELFYPVPTKIIYCYGVYQKEFEKLHNVDLVEGFPSNLDDLTKGHEQSIVVLDDLMSECSKDQRVSDLFTRGSHHKGVSVFYLTQNLFPPGKLSRTISLNCHYIFVFKNPRDSLGITTLAKQMFPRRSNYLVDAFHDATKHPYSYLLIDCHPQTPEDIRLRTNVLPGERQIVYIKK